MTAFCPLPLLIPCSVANTLRPPMKIFPDHMAEYCRTHGLIDVTFFNGFPYADTEYTGASVVGNAPAKRTRHDLRVHFRPRDP
ncbi:MAG: M81 family metallopeptidase [Lachnospiraceae bacterium]|nr:M81 family metallopeptidase [Lachnospiraceae bacterium]